VNVQISEVINAFKDLARMYLSEVEIFGVILVVLSIVIVVIIALRYEKRRRKMKELKRQRKMLTARLNKLAGGRIIKKS
jgi:hypothetical protein